MSEFYTVVIPVRVAKGESGGVHKELRVNVWAEDAQAAVDQLAENLSSLEDHLKPYPDSQR